MSMSHANCSHPKTPAARSACRKAQGRTASPRVERVNVDVPVDLLATAPVVDVQPHDVPLMSDQGHMGRADAVRITQDLLQQYGLNGWHITFSTSRRKAGTCNYSRRVITLSAPLMAQRTWIESHNTITHELAHALTPGHNHDQVWASKHRELGGDGARCFEHEDHTAPWLGTCSHGKVFPKYRAPKHPDAEYRCKCERNAPGFRFYPNPNA